jgi:Ni,Fe-hydrogenase III component G
MKKLMRAVLILVGIFTLSACSKPTDKKETEATKEARAKITVILKEDDQEFDKKEVEVQKNESLQTVMEKNFKVDMDKDFLVGIDGHKQDAKASKYWLYDIDGKQPEVGAVEYFPKNGETVTWSLNKL